MKIIENILLLEYFVLTVCALRLMRGQVSAKPYTIWGNQNYHGDQPDQLMDTRSKRSLFECGVHGQKPTIDSLSTETTLPGEWPWVVAVYNSGVNGLTYRCGGSLIDNRFVITAADCIYSSDNLKQMETKDVAIMVGAKDVSSTTYNVDNSRFLTAMYMHEEYDLETHNNNIALLVLKEPVTYSKLVRPVCMWEGEDDQDDLEKAFQHGTVVGWHRVAWVERMEAHRVDMSIISRATCRKLPNILYSSIPEKTFCAVTKDTKTFCEGSGDASLYIEQHGRWMLRGIAGLYLPLHFCSHTSIYSDVAKHRDWISDTAYRWSQTNIMPVAARTYAAGTNLSWTQQCSMRGEVNSLVAGGQSTREGEWPWHVAIYHNQHEGSSAANLYKCGGSLISASHVLTAAHCFINTLTNRLISKRSIIIYLGTHSIKYYSVGAQFKLVDRLDIHPEYKAETSYKDIAVLKLSIPAEFTAAIRPVCLWPEDEVDLSNVVGKNGSVVGWGFDEYGLLAEELMLAELPVVSELTCLRSNIFYHKYTNNFTFCAGQLKDTSVCNGDSGGGIVFKLRTGAATEEWFLRGLVSFSPTTAKQCDPSRYVIFTDVAKYLDWIKDSIARDM